jgi:hypothetical protein
MKWRNAAQVMPFTASSAIWPKFFLSPGQWATEPSTAKSTPHSDQRRTPFTDQSHKSKGFLMGVILDFLTFPDDTTTP